MDLLQDETVLEIEFQNTIMNNIPPLVHKIGDEFRRMISPTQLILNSEIYLLLRELFVFNDKSIRGQRVIIMKIMKFLWIV